MLGVYFHGDSTTKRPSRLILWSLLVLASILFAATISIRDAQATTARLAWDRNPEPDIAGYRVYYGTTSGSYSYDVDVGPVTSCAISGLQPKTTYYFAIKAYNALGDISDYSTEIRYPFSNQYNPGEIVASSSTGDLSGSSVSGEDSSSSSGSGGGSAGGGCFIATAAYGSYMAPEVMALREFRDSRLLTNAPGRAFVRFYYRTSPPVARFIHDHEILRTMARWTLTPVIYGVNYPGALLSMLLLSMLGFLLYMRLSQINSRDRALVSIISRGEAE
ncbi:MAG: fibronectin type III domain-containing protein [bacterium]